MAHILSRFLNHLEDMQRSLFYVGDSNNNTYRFMSTMCPDRVNNGDK